jgi:2-keto-3-deoxy-L-rhamnonate aldolase RhmA
MKRRWTALRKTIEAARRAGKHVMFNPGRDPEEIEKYVEMGVTMLELSNDLAILRSEWSKSGDVVRRL